MTRFNPPSRIRRYRTLIFLLAVLALRLAIGAFSELNASVSLPLREGEYHVTRVLDGLTFEVAPLHARDDLSTETWSVRLMGVGAANDGQDNTCDIERRSADLLNRLLEPAVVYLRLDKRRLDTERYPLAYVFVQGALINAEMLRAGLGVLDVQPGDSSPMVREMRAAESEARARRTGIWSASTR